MEWLKDMHPGTLPLLIPVVAIIMGGVYAITRAVLRHRERLAMIEKGMHPDYPPAESARPQAPSER